MQTGLGPPLGKQPPSTHVKPAFQHLPPALAHSHRIPRAPTKSNFHVYKNENAQENATATTATDCDKHALKCKTPHYLTTTQCQSVITTQFGPSGITTSRASRSGCRSSGLQCNRSWRAEAAHAILGNRVFQTHYGLEVCECELEPPAGPERTGRSYSKRLSTPSNTTTTRTSSSCFRQFQADNNKMTLNAIPI